MKKFISLSLCSLVAAAVLAGCGKEISKKDSDFERPSCSSPDVLKLIKYSFIENDYKRQQLNQSRYINAKKPQKKDESIYRFKSIRSVLSKSSANEIACTAILLEKTVRPLMNGNVLEDLEKHTIEYKASYSDDGKDLYLQLNSILDFNETPYGYVKGMM